MVNGKPATVHISKAKLALNLILLSLLTLVMCAIPVSADEMTTGYVTDVPGRIEMNLSARYDVDVNDPEGGLEIVTYNPANHTAYAIDGINSVLIAVPMNALSTDRFNDLSADGYQIDLAAAAEAAVSGFKYGDITSIDISPDHTKLAVAIQAAGYNDTGLVAVFPIDSSDDTLGTPAYYAVGVQPDMVIFADDATVLSADEGEPRMGYGTNSAGVNVIDPKGSISVINLASGTVTIADFTAFDSQRAALAASGVLMTKGQTPSVDLEPEYMVISGDGKTAYITLQENNAIGVLDIPSATLTKVMPLGFKDYGAEGNAIYLDGSARSYEDLYGAYMPDGLSLYETGGKTYLITANEGDGREWSSTEFPEDHEDAGDPNSDDTSYYSNETKITLSKEDDYEIKKVVVIDPEMVDGLPSGADVMFGGRSMTIFEVTANSLVPVYDSGSDFEDITAKLYPEWFNTSNSKLKLNDRSTKKGPEPENVTIGQINGHTYAFVVLERIGGIMAYDITTPSNSSYVNYINSRDFDAEDGIGGDSGPEGIHFIPASQSVTGTALLITGCEVTGTMPIYEITAYPGDLTGKLVILHTNDTHGGDVAVKGVSIGTAGVAKLAEDYRAAGAEVLLISAGDATQGDPLVNLSKGATAIDFMNLAQYDLMVPGNHEFDYDYDNLLKLKASADFPFVSANILDKTTGEPVFDAHVIFDTVIGKVGVFGLTTPETLTKANPDNVASLSFPEGKAMYAIAQAQVDALKAAGCSTIICVAHLGTDTGSEPNTSTDVLQNVKGINLLIDGHSHSVIEGDLVSQSVLTSAGTRLEYVGVDMLDGTSIMSTLVSAEDYSSVDPAINAVINAKSDEIDAQLAAKFAVSEVLLDGNRAPGVRTQETNLGDFAADAILWAANEAVGAGTVDAAITNGGGIRATIEIGDITMKDMKTVFPFGNTIATVKVTGAQLLELIEAATFSTPESLGAFPHVAGIEFTLNTAIPYAKGAQYPDSTYFAPAKPGTRVTNVKVAGKALDLNKTYTVATNNFTASGGDTYYLFKNCETFNTYVALEDALVNYTTEILGGVVTEAKYGQPAGRINIIAAAAPVQTEAAMPTAASGMRVYTVVSGDSLWKIASSSLGDGDRYMEIFNLNKTLLSNPDMIAIGQTLTLPAE
ncbi:choice-of-anchor I family protein [Fusibacter paucivorans]|uniref:Choice-of-anchor I family protein n=1 Tax=Fusibacter paucivorans TaxID=76009 RepID=A0ABS5PNV3_9FIRM|nr:choice-of-anchor I family protein [Fusibacter paucivorans]MBS7526859.1 choice-of-anchor I family protein [Fusibacter paucivorans]